MPAIKSHGAGCCGVSHIWAFQYYGGLSDKTKDDFRRQITAFKEKNPSRLLEACLNDSQMMNWAPLLQEAGFKLVTRFVNSNSGNPVNVLHLVSAKPRTIRYKVPPMPFDWETK